MLDALPDCNPFPFATGVFDGGASGADFTVAHRPNRERDPHAESLGDGRFAGMIAGLAIYDRALSDREMAGLHRRPA